MSTFYRRKDHIVTRHIGDETILVPVKNNLADMLNLFVLNAVGECIWNALDEAVDKDALCCAVMATFDVKADQARADTEAFLGELASADLLAEQ